MVARSAVRVPDVGLAFRAGGYLDMDRRVRGRTKRRARGRPMFEPGRPIDRFEAVYRLGKCEGFGRYDWPSGTKKVTERY